MAVFPLLLVIRPTDKARDASSLHHYHTEHTDLHNEGVCMRPQDEAEGAGVARRRIGLMLAAEATKPFLTQATSAAMIHPPEYRNQKSLEDKWTFVQLHISFR